jgi:hypothetical protein
MERDGSRRVNRRRVYVDSRAVLSVSALEDIVDEEYEVGLEDRPH